MDDFVADAMDSKRHAKKILIIEPFYGGSHKILLDVVLSGLDPNSYLLISMTAKKWPWRARCSALFISQTIPHCHQFSHLICSSVLPLAELLGLRPDLANLLKVVYCHENQLIFPIKVIKKRDYQYGYNEITTYLAADIILFNSNFNKDSFLCAINKFIGVMPDYRPKKLSDVITNKAKVIYFPLDLNLISSIETKCREEILQFKNNNRVKHLVWPHRWEFDKNPSLLFKTLYLLKSDLVPFKISLLGDSFSEIPSEFQEAQSALREELKHFGYVESREEYYKILLKADIIISTADHEFFGVSVAEGVLCGLVPLLPNKLVYPELYPKEFLYNNEDELFHKLKKMCLDPNYFCMLKDGLQTNLTSFEKSKWLDKFFNITHLETYAV